MHNCTFIIVYSHGRIFLSRFKNRHREWVSGGISDLKQNGKNCSVFHGLSRAEIRLVVSVSSRKRKLKHLDWLLKKFKRWFLELILAKNGSHTTHVITFHNRAYFEYERTREGLKKLKKCGHYLLYECSGEGGGHKNIWE